MKQEEHAQKVYTFFNEADPSFTGNLREALFTFSELGLWPDSVDSVSVEQALLCWKIIEKLRTWEFPEELWV